LHNLKKIKNLQRKQTKFVSLYIKIYYAGKNKCTTILFPIFLMKKITEMSLKGLRISYLFHYFQIVPSPGELYSVLSERVNAA
jgi:hypothetical protein